jgi:hypothetical protein
MEPEAAGRRASRPKQFSDNSQESAMSLLWLIIVIIIVLAVLGFVFRGRF